MMMHEFIERTGYTPTAEEYHYIEESYYEADTPYKDEQKAEYEAKIAEQEENLEFYRGEFKKYMKAREKMKAIENIMAAM